MISPPPTKIRAHKQAGLLELQWDDALPHNLPFRFIRTHCPCAMCIDEFTGRRILDPQTIPHDILPAEMGFTGNYALKITWSDGHSTGLYTWDHLGELVRQFEAGAIADSAAESSGNSSHA